MPERYAIYYAPPVTSPLWALATDWLGRDSLTGATPELNIAGLSFATRFAMTHAARRYGFHATIKAPMALDGKLEPKDLDRALKAWSAANVPVGIGRLVLKPIGGFLALVPAEQTAGLTEFAGRVVADFDGFRAPLAPEDRARRIHHGHLNEHETALLDAYGYPYVMDAFLFHMTLTDKLDDADRAVAEAAAATWFGTALAEELLLDRLVLFQEAEPGAPFRRLRDYPLTGHLQ